MIIKIVVFRVCQMSLGPCRQRHYCLQLASSCVGSSAPSAAFACTVARVCQVCVCMHAYHVEFPVTCCFCCASVWQRLLQPCLNQSPAAVAICSLLFSVRLVALQTLAKMHGGLHTHADIKMENIHVAVKQRWADTVVTVLDFGISGYHPNSGSIS